MIMEKRWKEGGEGKGTNQTVATPYFLLVRTWFVSWVFWGKGGMGGVRVERK
jgi:hypothetical protein